MMKRFAGLPAVLLLLSVSALLYAAPGYGCKFTAGKKDAIYQIGDKISCQVEITDDGKPYSGKIRVRTLWEKNPIGDQTLDYDGKPLTLTYQSEAAGWLVWQVQLLDLLNHPRKRDDDRNFTESIGILISPNQILPKLEKPADFRKFWQEEHGRLQSIPPEIKLTACPVDGQYAGEVELFHFSISCPGKAPARGLLALPKAAKTGSCPAIVKFQDLVRRDVSSLECCNLSKRYHAIVLLPSWHCLEPGKEPEYYRQETGNMLIPGYILIHINDRRNWFAHDMIFRCFRALDYVKSRPEWNQKDLAVAGGGNGAYQAIVAAALDHDVTAVVASAPTCGEFNARKVLRTPPFLFSHSSTWKRLADPDVAECLSYHDAVNFATMVKAACLFQAGLTDMICPPSTVTAIYNALPPFTKKEIIYRPGGHNDSKKTLTNTYTLLDRLWTQK